MADYGRREFLETALDRHAQMVAYYAKHPGEDTPDPMIRKACADWNDNALATEAAEAWHFAHQLEQETV